MKKSFRKRKGFTLIEMTIVLFIISLLVLIIIPNISGAKDHATKVHQSAMASMVKSQLENYLDDRPENDKKSNSNITLDTLGDGYLTKDQISKAKDEGIAIGIDKNNNNNLVVTINGKDANDKSISSNN